MTAQFNRSPFFDFGYCVFFNSMKTIKRITGILLLVLLVAVGSFGALLWSGIIWRSPAYYEPATRRVLEVPIMDMKAYDSLGDHARPYIYQVQGKGGSVYILGIEHTRDPKDAQLDSIRRIFESYQPDIAFVEGRLGFLFSGLQEPVTEHGEGGLTVQLAKKKAIPFYTWEPEKNAEIRMMLETYTPKQLALFYSLRPYFSNYRFGKPADPDAQMQEYISSRTDKDGIRGVLNGVASIDSFWKAEYPVLPDWRETSDEYGWPKGWLQDIAAHSNLVRDIHLCQSILDAARGGRKVLVTMGSSHAFRIRKTLEHAFSRAS